MEQARSRIGQACGKEYGGRSTLGELADCSDRGPSAVGDKRSFVTLRDFSGHCRMLFSLWPPDGVDHELSVAADISGQAGLFRPFYKLC